MTPSDQTLKRRRPSTVSRLLTDAIERRIQIDLVYRREDEEIRRFSPYEIVGNVYVIGWDHWRNNYRSFRLDRIVGAALIDQPAFQVEDE